MKHTYLNIQVSGAPGSGKTQLLKHLHASPAFVPQGFDSATLRFTEQGSDELVFTKRANREPDIPIQSPEEVRKNPAYRPVLVPLGPNRTRDGREARVICLDRDDKRPVVALIRQSDGVEATQYYYSAGRRGDHEQDLDLVGHLPPAEPEAGKPREFWVTEYKDGGSPNRIIYENPPYPPTRVSPNRRTFHVREVLPGQDDELEALRRWKREAEEILGTALTWLPPGDSCVSLIRRVETLLKP